MSNRSWYASDPPKPRVDVHDALDERDAIRLDLFDLFYGDDGDDDAFPAINATPLRVSFLEAVRAR